MPEWFDRARSQLGLTDDDVEGDEQSLLAQWNQATTLNRTERLIGFGVCFALGLMLSFLSPLFILRPTKFAVIFTIGNLLSIGATAFLMGPLTQVKRMFQPRRLLSTCVFLVSMVATLASVLALHSVLLCLLCLVVQFAAYIWYCLSYVPGGQAFVLRMFGISSLTDDGGL